MADPGFDTVRAHRWFAIDLNNRAWDLIESDDRSADVIDRLLQAAHASAYHWSHAGDALNAQRAACLVATAYVAAGLPDSAVRYAERCVELNDANGDAPSDFDRATTHGVAAAAYRLAERPDDAARHRVLADQAAGQLAADDRAVVDKLYPAG